MHGCTLFFKTPSSHTKILGARKVTWSTFHTEPSQILGAIIQNFVTQATWNPEFVHPCHNIHIKFNKNSNMISNWNGGHAEHSDIISPSSDLTQRKYIITGEFLAQSWLWLKRSCHSVYQAPWHSNILQYYWV
jgi:hypothetical protein